MRYLTKLSTICLLVDDIRELSLSVTVIVVFEMHSDLLENIQA